MTDETQAWIDETVRANPVVLFMKGTRQFPQYGFSAAVVGVRRPADQPFRHHSRPHAIHVDDATMVAISVRRWNHGRAAADKATPASIGKNTGNATSTWPTLVATPFPPRNPLWTGWQWPTTAAVASRSVWAT